MNSSSRVTETQGSRREWLRAIAARHGVVFEVHCTQVPHEQGLRVIGYDVFLVGRHASPPPLSPGCSKCQAIWSDLGVLAHAALPRPGHLTHFTIRPFDHALHYLAGQSNAAEVELVIEVRHRSDYCAALDACEDVCLTKLLANLRALGLRER